MRLNRAANTHAARQSARRAFTLTEVLVAGAIGSLVAGGTVLLLWQTAVEQLHGFADMTVEEESYILQARLASCLRVMSATQGMTPDYSSSQYDANGNLLGYTSVFVFSPNNGGYIMGNIQFNSASGVVTYTSNLAVPEITRVWMSNTPTFLLTNFYFNTSYNSDGSQDSSLANVSFQMNDNGYSQQGTMNNPTSIQRSFSVQMRNDN